MFLKNDLLIDCSRVLEVFNWQNPGAKLQYNSHNPEEKNPPIRESSQTNGPINGWIQKSIQASKSSRSMEKLTVIAR